MSEQMIDAWFLPPGTMTEPMRIKVINNLETIRTVIDCDMIDAVRIGIAKDSAATKAFIAVGYVDDDGIANSQGPESINWLASALFDRLEDPLMGYVLVVSGTNPDTGEYDGENYDLPAWFNNEQRCDQLVAFTAGEYNQVATLAGIVIGAVSDGVISEDEFLQALNDQNIDSFHALAKMAVTYGLMDVKVDTDLDEELKGLLDDNQN